MCTANDRLAPCVMLMTYYCKSVNWVLHASWNYVVVVYAQLNPVFNCITAHVYTIQKRPYWFKLNCVFVCMRVHRIKQFLYNTMVDGVQFKRIYFIWTMHKRTSMLRKLLSTMYLYINKNTYAIAPAEFGHLVFKFY